MNKLLSIVFFVFSLMCEGGDWRDQWAESGSIWLDKWMTTFDSLNKHPKNEQIAILGAAIEVKSSGGNENSTADQLAVASRAIDLLLAIPNYAQYFADEIERERKLIEDIPPEKYRRGEYDGIRYRYLFNILPQLQDPQAIRVLGEYLYDERDPYPSSLPSQDWAGPPENAQVASRALMKINLRNPPAVKRIFEAADTLERQREWYSKVKSGELAFSFIGQTVEYRFKPDGTWETTALPESVLEQDPKPVSLPSFASEKSAASNMVSTKPQWLWILGGTMALLSAAAWLRLRGSAART